MPTQGDETQRLRQLHEEYAWRVNAAIGEGREDLVWKLSDAYLVEAMQTMMDERPSDCERPGCAICTPPPSAGSRRASRRDRLRRWFAGGRG